MKKILIISLTPVASEPRVIRQSAYLISKGFYVSVAGLPGKDKIDEKWNFIDLEKVYNNFSAASPSLQWTFKRIVKGILRRFNPLFYYPLMNRLFYCLFGGFLAEKKYWEDPIYHSIEDFLKTFKADLIICHDYYTSPIAYNLSVLWKVKVIIDVHEHAITQMKTDNIFKNIRWFFIYRLHAHSLQKKYLPKMDKIITVSNGIACDLYDTYKLQEKPIVIRSVPFYTSTSYNPASEKIRILYHGLLAPGRGLEDTIRTMSFLKKNFTLTLQGHGRGEYVNRLKQIVKKENVEDRVIFKPSVPFSEIVQQANQYDIGIFVTKNISLQKKYVLPNKFFEYIMGGLALCVSDFPEMAEIVRQYKVGLLISNSTPEKIADELNRLTLEDINAFKKNSLRAAKDLNWEIESNKMGFIDLYLKEEKNVSSH